ncbi:Uncharacterised protein [Mycobacterium tuberculosis]|nr:Uncharacterised protein [Mycobacterium tuberculosis]
MLTSMTVSERAPPASSASPAPILAFAPARESIPTSKKFSSPCCPLGLTMSPECGSSALTMFSRLFFDALHCHAPPVSANARAANRAASERAASTIGRRPEFGAGLAGAGDVRRIRNGRTRADPVSCLPGSSGSRRAWSARG